MAIFTTLIQSLLNQNLFVAFILQTVVLLFAPQLILLILNSQKKSRLLTALSTLPVIAGLAVLIFFPIKVGTNVSIDFSSFFLMLILAFSGSIVGTVSFIVSIAFLLVKYFDGFWLRLIPYIVSLFLVIFGRNIRFKRNFNKKRYYVYVFAEALLTSASVFLTSSLIGEASQVLITGGVILFLVAPIFLVIIVLVFNRNKNFLINYEIVANQERLHRSLLTSAYNIQIIAVDLDFNYLSFNEQHERVLADLYNTKPVVGLNILSLINDPVDRSRVERSLSRALQGEIFEADIELGARKGLSFQESYAPIRESNGEVIGATIFVSELSERLEREKRIQYLSYHDQGTGLYNRRYFDEFTRNLTDYKGPVCVVYADINGLKITNDLFGHEAGDELLIAVTNKLQSEFQNEMIARIGGDEIVLVLQTGEVKELEKNILRIKKELQETIVSHLVVSVSFGVAIAKTGTAVFKAVQEAEDKMYSDKAKSVNGQNKDVVEVLLTKMYTDFNLIVSNHEVNDLALEVGQELSLTNGSLDSLKEVAKLQLVAYVYTPDRCPHIGRKVSFEESSILRKRLSVINRLILTTEIFNPISLDLVSIFENYNGSGAPRGLQHEEIPLKARILRLVIDYVNLKWREKLSPQEVLNKLEPNIGELYDPQVYATLVKLLKVKDNN